MLRNILKEMREHAPYTFLGALSGILLFFFLRKIPENLSFTLFYIFHPVHVLFSAFVTVSLYKIYLIKCNETKPNLINIFLIGYIGSVGIGTLSDSIIPYLGEKLLNFPHSEPHIGFIEKWYIINPIAILGIIGAYFFPSTKVPHLGHVLLSTWASLFHVAMAVAGGVSFTLYLAILILLFLAVWLPCCVSDIVFPLLFVVNNNHRGDKK